MLVVALLAAASALVPAADADETMAAGESIAVVAFLDNGINPYHVAFRDTSPRAYQYPGTYIPDYPAGAIALHVTTDAPTYADAVEADCALWESIESGQLYWFPGTRIVGAIEFFDGPQGCIYDSNGELDVHETSFWLPILGTHHGTMVASRGAATGYGACPECLIVVAPGSVEAIAWSAQNADWIDADSNSWWRTEIGVSPTCVLWCPNHVVNLEADAAEAQVTEANAQAHLSFRAAGNGLSGSGGIAGIPYVLPNANWGVVSSTPSTIVVGAMDSGHMTSWHGLPVHLVSDGCHSWGAQWDSIEVSGPTLAGGTSGATPFVAGGAAQVLRAARAVLGDARSGVHDGVVAAGPAGLVPTGPLADGEFTLEEWKRLVLATATARPEAQFEDGPACGAEDVFLPTPVLWKDVPPGYPEFIHIGYGAVDRPAMYLATKVLRGEARAPDRPVTDAYMVAEGTVRATLHEHYLNPPGDPL